jgi:pyridoxal phosphate enzyme (YggS family)
MNDKLKQVQAQIKEAETLFHREPGSVLLLAVSKTKPAQAIAELYCAGQRHFGENYCQEALQKQTELGGYDITWHFIGPIQSNKTKMIATHFAWVHSVDRFKTALRLSEQRPETLPPLNICLQINISAENSKSGVSLAELPELCEKIGDLPRLKLRGVMAIPAPAADFSQQRKPYRLLYEAVKQLKAYSFDTFSYGMSGDLQAAIAEGATIVRVGTALFGERH